MGHAFLLLEAGTGCYLGPQGLAGRAGFPDLPVFRTADPTHTPRFSPASMSPMRPIPLCFLLSFALLLLLGLVGCGETPTPTTPAQDQDARAPAWRPPTWEAVRERQHARGGSVAIRADSACRLRFELVGATLEPLGDALPARNVPAGEAVRIDWFADLVPVDQPREAPPAEAVAAGRTRAWALRLVFGFSDRGELRRHVLCWTRPEVAAKETVLQGLAPSRPEAMPVAGPVWVGAAAGGAPRETGTLLLRPREDRIELRLRSESGTKRLDDPPEEVLGLRIEALPPTR